MGEGRRLDLITMGRCILDVYGEQTGCDLEDVSSFSKYVGGCPTNIAIGTARLGLRTALISRVGDEHHGRYIRAQLVREGVDTSCLRTDPHRLTGVAFLAVRDKITFPLLHYRDDCADMAIEPSDYSDEVIGSATALLVSGSHLTTPKAADNLESAVARARRLGTKVIFDIDYRPLFWRLVNRDAGESRYEPSGEATAATQRVLPRSDLVIGTEEEVHLAGGSTDTLTALRAIRSLTAAPIVLKRGPDGCIVFPDAIPDTLDGGVVGPGFPVEVFNVVGAGDGFLSGFLYGWLQERPWAECCRLGNACGALVVSRHGCSPASPTRAELDWFLAEPNLGPRLRENYRLERLHRATTRLDRPDPVFVVACDHGAAFDSLPRAEGRTVHGFKSAVASAVLRLARRQPGLGVIFDGEEGEDALYRIGDGLPWVARKIEWSGRIPLALAGDLPAGIQLREWPRHQIAKCLVPEADGAGAVLQNERLRELGLATEHYGIELLLEFVHPDSPEGVERVCERIAAVQALGVRPDWWKLPAFSDPAAWPAIEAAVRRDNEHCRGVVLLGAGRELPELANAFAIGAEAPLVRGFAVGRTLLAEIARDWLGARLDDRGLEDALAVRLGGLIAAWPGRSRAA